MPLVAAGLGIAATVALDVLLPLGAAERLESTTMVWSLANSPLAMAAPSLGDGPVISIITYQVQADNAPAFRAAMRTRGDAKRRASGMQWGQYRDTDNPAHDVEVFMAGSWAEHLHQCERPTESDLKEWQATD